MIQEYNKYNRFHITFIIHFCKTIFLGLLSLLSVMYILKTEKIFVQILN